MTRVEQAASALKLLAAPAADQIEQLSVFFGKDLKSRLEHNIDELVLQFEDIAKAAESMRENNEITTNQATALIRLDNILAELSNTQSARFWTAAALVDDPTWNYVRHEALECLKILNHSTL